MSEPDRGGRDAWKRILSALALAAPALAAVALFPAGAAAGTYDVVACDAAPGGVNAAWTAHDDAGTVAATSCPTAGDERRGLAVRNLLNEGTVDGGDGASMTLRAPEGAALESIAYDWDGRQADTGWMVGMIGDPGSELLAGCPARPGAGGRCRLGTPDGREETVRDLNGGGEVSFVAICRVRAGCSTASLGDSTDRTRARLAVHSATVAVTDSSVPGLSATGGSLLADRWLAGQVEADFHAGDNVGVRATSFEVDGHRRNLDPRECDYTRRVPCPRAITRAYSLDTRDLTDGPHEVAVDAVDTAGNRARLSRSIRVDNHAPGAVAGLHVVGGDQTRGENSFDVRWTVPGGQAAPIARAHYRLCRAGAAPADCVIGARDGPNAGIDALAVPGRGDWRLEVWLEDEAGNVAPGSAPEPVTLSFDDRAPTRLSAAIITATGDAAAHVTTDYGAPVTVGGTLTDVGGDRLGGVPLTVLSRLPGEERFERVATVETDEQGGFAYRAPTGPSRKLRVEYAGSDRHRPAAGEVALWVRAASSISVSDHHVRNGDRVLFEGRLRGGPYPAEGKLVELQAYYRDRWRTFAVTRTSGGGAWSYRYRFGGTRGRLTYPFRARIPRERSYPYVLGHSRVVRVTVNGR